MTENAKFAVFWKYLQPSKSVVSVKLNGNLLKRDSILDLATTVGFVMISSFQRFDKVWLSKFLRINISCDLDLPLIYSAQFCIWLNFPGLLFLFPSNSDAGEILTFQVNQFSSFYRSQNDWKTFGNYHWSWGNSVWSSGNFYSLIYVWLGPLDGFLLDKMLWLFKVLFKVRKSHRNFSRLWLGT